MRKCYNLTEFLEDGSRVQGVAKFCMTHGGESAKKVCFADAKMQMVSEYFAQQFNKRSPSDCKISFVVSQVLELLERSSSQQPWATMEPLLSGEYNKHNDNNGGVMDRNPIPQAFSHFTFEESQHQLVICDIQGVGATLFTDPQIHTQDGHGFGLGNLGPQGMKRFLHSHTCNRVCQAMGLPTLQSRVAQHAMRGPGGGIPMTMGMNMGPGMGPGMGQLMRHMHVMMQQHPGQMMMLPPGHLPPPPDAPHEARHRMAPAGMGMGGRDPRDMRDREERELARALEASREESREHERRVARSRDVQLAEDEQLARALAESMRTR